MLGDPLLYLVRSPAYFLLAWCLQIDYIELLQARKTISQRFYNYPLITILSG
jgi:hypothetical protein